MKQTILVTGASSGFGLLIANKLHNMKAFILAWESLILPHWFLFCHHPTIDSYNFIQIQIIRNRLQPYLSIGKIYFYEIKKDYFP